MGNPYFFVTLFVDAEFYTVARQLIVDQFFVQDQSIHKILSLSLCNGPIKNKIRKLRRGSGVSPEGTPLSAVLRIVLDWGVAFGAGRCVGKNEKGRRAAMRSLFALFCDHFITLKQ